MEGSIREAARLCKKAGSRTLKDNFRSRLPSLESIENSPNLVASNNPMVSRAKGEGNAPIHSYARTNLLLDVKKKCRREALALSAP